MAKQQCYKQGKRVPLVIPKEKCWARLFLSEQSDDGQAVNITLTLHQYEQFTDYYNVGRYLMSYSVDGRSVSLLPRGLVNRSNFCFVNSILQALLACPPLYHFFTGLSRYFSPKNVKKSTPVMYGISRFVRQFDYLPSNIREKVRKVDANGKVYQRVIVTRGTSIEPTWIYEMLYTLRPDLEEGRQEDAEEFLGILLNGITDELALIKKFVKDVTKDGHASNNSSVSNEPNNNCQMMRSNNNVSETRIHFDRTPISDIFGGLLRSRIHRVGDRTTDTIQPFFTLPLDIKNVNTVEEALEALITKTPLEGLISSTTNKEVEAWQQVKLNALPVVLVLHLKCFDFQLDGCTKIVKTLEFGVDLTIDSKLLSSDTQTPKERQYKLFAVVYHEGREATNGHYVTDAFHVGYNCWLRYNDTSVKKVPEEHLLKPQGTRVPYLLFYRRCDTVCS